FHSAVAACGWRAPFANRRRRRPAAHLRELRQSRALARGTGPRIWSEPESSRNDTSAGQNLAAPRAQLLHGQATVGGAGTLAAAPRTDFRCAGNRRQQARRGARTTAGCAIALRSVAHAALTRPASGPGFSLRTSWGADGRNFSDSTWRTTVAF